tara:strand:+ start:772 stop:1533 length:762 start_codon:yes stop_codon:yes gene_type:complete
MTLRRRLTDTNTGATLAALHTTTAFTMLASFADSSVFASAGATCGCHSRLNITPRRRHTRLIISIIIICGVDIYGHGCWCSVKLTGPISSAIFVTSTRCFGRLRRLGSILTGTCHWYTATSRGLSLHRRFISTSREVDGRTSNGRLHTDLTTSTVVIALTTGLFGNTTPRRFRGHTILLTGRDVSIVTATVFLGHHRCRFGWDTRFRSLSQITDVASATIIIGITTLLRVRRHWNLRTTTTPMEGTHRQKYNR